ncbi:HAMP domain-containing sensor histidine kinase [Maricaulis sp.]|uniref:sensor histidine kinase n=1 Tax=Maricaulis sp. TaxID=1486257 RepID=UPI00261CCBFD|nr:HAMP domain-containing sensor histidine kinase [Maricaulis sp.]
MIWDPVLLKSVLDLFYAAATITVIVLLIRCAQTPALHELRGDFFLITIGLFLRFGFYGLDLMTVVLGPGLIGQERALAFSDYLHTSVQPPIDFISTIFLIIGFLQLLRRLMAMFGRMQRSEAALRQELGSRSETESELIAKAERQRVSNRSKSEFMVGISHELRTPLNGIIGLASLMSNTDMSGDQRKLLSTLEQSAKAMLSRVNDVLDLARLESGQIELRTQSFSPCELARNVDALYQPFAGEKGLELKTSCTDDAQGLVIGDAVLIKQALNNLVSNAIKYTPSGSVSIETDVHAAAAERLWLQIWVSDTGIGMDQAIIDRVADPMHTINEGETGLGLAIASRIVKLLNGRLLIETTRQTGTRIGFQVQVQIEPEADDD